MKLSIVFGVLLTSGCMHADASTKSFVMNNRKPVIAGSKILAPGSHVWKLMDSASNRHIVQITNKQTGAVEAVILAIPRYRATTESKNLVQFWETPVGYPQAVRTWFYPGDNSGQEFAYPRAMLAAWHPVALSRPQLAHNNPVGSIRSNAKRDRHQDSGSWAIIEGGAASPIKHSASTSSTVDHRHEVAVNNTSQTSHTFWDTLRRLPRTATIAPLIALIGLVSLGWWLALYFKRKTGKLYT